MPGYQSRKVAALSSYSGPVTGAGWAPPRTWTPRSTQGTIPGARATRRRTPSPRSRSAGPCPVSIRDAWPMSTPVRAWNSRSEPAVGQPFLAHLAPEVPGRANRFASHDSSLSQRRSAVRAQSLWSLYPRSGERIVRAGDASSRRHAAPGQTMQTSDEPGDFTRLDDSALLSWRARARTELERLRPRSAAREALSALYDASLDELVERARKAWAKTS